MDYNKDVIIFDLETPKKCFLASFYIVEKKEYIDFLINSDRNDLFKLTKFLSDNKNKYFVFVITRNSKLKAQTAQ